MEKNVSTDFVGKRLQIFKKDTTDEQLFIQMNSSLDIFTKKICDQPNPVKPNNRETLRSLNFTKVLNAFPTFCH